jgi:hypothetical protein
MKSIKTTIADVIARTRFGQALVTRETMPVVSMDRPSNRIAFGVVLIAASYILGWPAVGACAAIALHLKSPLVLAVGGPAFYGFSWIVWSLGMYLVGRESYEALQKLWLRALWRFLKRNSTYGENASPPPENSSESSSTRPIE